MTNKPRLLKIPAPIMLSPPLVVRTPGCSFQTIKTTRIYAEKKPSRMTRAQWNQRLANQIAASFKAA
jgi:hypothetical protein